MPKRIANPNAVTKSTGLTPLADALFFLAEDTIPRVKELLSRGADPRVFIRGVPIREYLAKYVADRKYDKKQAQAQVNDVLQLLDAAEKTMPRREMTRDATEESGLLQKIAASPEDRDALARYSDWLLERGIGWGEYLIEWMTLQKTPPGSAEYASQARIVQKNAQKHVHDWLEPIRPALSSWKVKGPILGQVTCYAKAFGSLAAQVADFAPRGRLALERLRELKPREIAALPFGLFSGIDLQGQRMEDNDCIAVAKSKNAEGVQVWNLLSNEDVTSTGVQAIAESKCFSSTRELEIAADKAGLRALFSSKNLPNIERFGLQIRSFDDFPVKSTHNLKQLYLSIVDLPQEEQFEAFAELPWTKSLEHMQIYVGALQRNQHKKLARLSQMLTRTLPKLTKVESTKFVITRDRIQPNEHGYALFGRPAPTVGGRYW